MTTMVFMETSGLSNIQRMEKGRAPIGVDGESINLHHLDQSANGALAEVTATLHKGNSSVIHINPPSIPSGINRPEFNKWRSAYWKNRAKDLKSGNGK